MNSNNRANDPSQFRSFQRQWKYCQEGLQKIWPQSWKRLLHQLFSSKDAHVTWFTCENITKWQNVSDGWTHGALSFPHSSISIMHLNEESHFFVWIDLMVEFYQLSLFIIMFPPWKKQYHSTQKSKDKYSPSWRWISYGSTCNVALLITPRFFFFFFWQWGYPLGIYPIGLIFQDTCTTYTRGLGCWQGSSWRSNWFQTNPTRIQLTLWTDWVTVQFIQL